MPYSGSACLPANAQEKSQGKTPQWISVADCGFQVYDSCVIAAFDQLDNAWYQTHRLTILATGECFGLYTKNKEAVKRKELWAGDGYLVECVKDPLKLGASCNDVVEALQYGMRAVPVFLIDAADARSPKQARVTIMHLPMWAQPMLGLMFKRREPVVPSRASSRSTAADASPAPAPQPAACSSTDAAPVTPPPARKPEGVAASASTPDTPPFARSLLAEGAARGRAGPEWWAAMRSLFFFGDEHTDGILRVLALAREKAKVVERERIKEERSKAKAKKGKEATKRAEVRFTVQDVPITHMLVRHSRPCTCIERQRGPCPQRTVSVSLQTCGEACKVH